MVGPLGQALVGHAPLGQVGQLGDQQGQLLGQLDRTGRRSPGRPSAAPPRSTCRTPRRSAAGRARRGTQPTMDSRRLWATVRRVDVGRIVADAEAERTQAATRWHHRQAEAVDHEQVERRTAAAQHERRDEAEEVEGRDRAGAAKARLGQLVDDAWDPPSSRDSCSRSTTLLVDSPRRSGAALALPLPASASRERRCSSSRRLATDLRRLSRLSRLAHRRGQGRRRWRRSGRRRRR